MLLGLLLPPPTVAIPLFTQLREMGLLNTPWALILPGAAWSLSLTVFLMRAYFNTHAAGHGGGRQDRWRQHLADLPAGSRCRWRGRRC